MFGGGGVDRVKYEYILAYPQGSCWTAINQGTEKEKILVYGCGQLFRTREKEINQIYEIAAFIDLYKHGFYAGIEIIKPEEMVKFGKIKVLIMIKDVSEFEKVKKSLIYEIGVENANILEWNK